MSAQAPERGRKLHLGHFAFARALVQGIDTRDSWERYLQIEGEHGDARIQKRTIAWIRAEFAAAAKRCQRPGTARLVMMDAQQIPEPPPTLPSLESFALEQGMEDFSHAEQVERYREHFGGASQRQSRRARLIARQLAALAWLEALVAQAPQAGDALAAWLRPELAARLEAVGLFTLRQLAERINGIGLLWWRPVRSVGAAKAERIVEWLRGHAASTGLAIGGHALAPRASLAAEVLAGVVPVAPLTSLTPLTSLNPLTSLTSPVPPMPAPHFATAIAPLEKLLVPHHLSGSDGLYRAPRRLCLMAADNDHDAVLAWLRSKRGVAAGKPSHTQRAYRKEAERFLLWAVAERGKAMSSMTLEDCDAYRAFLADPAPSWRWCGPRCRQKWSPLWRPFEGPLSARAQSQAVTILKSLYTFLVDQCYLIGNPWKGVAAPKADAARGAKGRSFSLAQWAFIVQRMETLPDTSTNQRLRFALQFFHGTGLRLAEGVAARVDDLHWVHYPADAGGWEALEGWELHVLGKGHKPRVVPVPQDVVAALSTYLAARGLDPDPEAARNRGSFLLGKALDVGLRAPWSKAANVATASEGIQPGTLYGQFKRFFRDAAHALAASDEKGALRLAAASTHWLRHTHGSHAVAAGVPLEILQQNLGHASIDTTTLYTTTEDRRRMKAMQQFWQQKQGGGNPGP